MKRYLKYIFLALTATLMAVSCIEELKPETPVFQKDALTLVPRVQSFANQYVTKANDSIDETSISALGVLVFNEDGELVHYQENASTNQNKLTLYKSLINSSAQEGKLDNATIVLFANMTLSDLKNGSQTVLDKIKTNTLTLADMENYIYSPSSDKTVITPDEENFTGFPMIGGTSADLSSGSSAEVQEVTLNMLYTKVRFNIAVTQSSENQGTGMKFELTGCTVHNTANSIPLAIPATYGKQPVDFLGRTIPNSEPAEGDGTTLSSIYNTEQDGISIDATGTATFSNNSNADDDEIVEFTFYVLESRYNHNGLDGVYPWNDWFTSEPAEDVKNYNAATDDAKRNGVKYFYDDLIQQYKPKLAEGGKATYVELNGTYTDYRGTAWDVDYTIYLGKDNAQNFQVDRNSEYTNIITIKGIRNHDGYGTGQVWLDHRVNVSLGAEQGAEQGADDCITITRETLIDSHIEVRPLRVKWEDDRYVGAAIYLPRYDGKQIEEGGSSKNWIGIENNDGIKYQDVTKYSNNGKRKYFTTDLINDLHTNNPDIETNAGEKIIPISNNDCIWIYIDEYTDINAKSCREAELELRFYKKDKSYDSEKYIIRQQPLISISEDIYIESYEEYLHSYDSEDNYNLDTSPSDYTQQGIVWGLNDDIITNQSILSKSYFTINGFKNTWLDGTIISGDSRYKFEFALAEDESGFSVVDSNKKPVTLEDSGLAFTKRIAVDAKKNVTIADMSQIPESAIQYCLSKNKFYVSSDENVSHHIDIHWYLPAIDEMNTILADEQFSEEYYYWSSQPAYEKVTYDGDNYLLIENPSYARATNGSTDARPTNTTYRSISTSVTNWGALVGEEPIFDKMPGYHSRITKNRIRCAYSKTGKTGTQITAPDGIGPKTIYMRAKRKDTGGDGYFKQYVPQTATPTPIPPKEFGDAFYPYPTTGDLADGSFSYDPSKFIASGKDWVTRIDVSLNDLTPDSEDFTLGKYPGLSAKVIVGPTFHRESALLYYYTMTESESSGDDAWKSDTKTIISQDKKVVDYHNLEEVALNKLDGPNGIFSIRFDNASNDTNKPKYEYDETVSVKTETWTRHWMVPTYESNKIEVDETLPAETFTVNGVVGRAGLYQVLGSWIVATTNAITTRYNNKEDAKEAALNAAISAAKSQLDKEIETKRESNQYDENIVISDLTHDIVSEDVKEETTGIFNRTTYYGVTYTINMSAIVTFTKTGEKEFWVYKAGTGRWYNESDPEWPTPTKDGDKKWPNFYTYDESDPVIEHDELTLYSGNAFTVSVADGYVIGGIKIYFSGSNKLPNNKYLRLVPSGYTSAASHPEGMAFVDAGEGDEGYAEWGTQEKTKEISLQLVECTLYQPNWIEQIFGAKPSINYSGSVSSPNESIIIEKMEITYMKSQQ